jgi:hypothetical protein
MTRSTCEPPGGSAARAISQNPHHVNFTRTRVQVTEGFMLPTLRERAAGAAAVEIERVIEALPVGGLSARPVASDGAMRLVRRIDPALGA